MLVYWPDKKTADHLANKLNEIIEELNSGIKFTSWDALKKIRKLALKSHDFNDFFD